ncbi:YrdB family protein [Arthrobacter sp. MYb227]|uniref:YrdB family protein n=1 Tax=Arthrobacter sp. MYb227 TaxID=1848601 RepID=UPI0015E37A8B|nr:YrdB family protein [Arthrobacter sp. MYb227]
MHSSVLETAGDTATAAKPTPTSAPKLSAKPRQPGKPATPSEKTPPVTPTATVDSAKVAEELKAAATPAPVNVNTPVTGRAAENQISQGSRADSAGTPDTVAAKSPAKAQSTDINRGDEQLPDSEQAKMAELSEVLAQDAPGSEEKTDAEPVVAGAREANPQQKSPAEAQESVEPHNVPAEPTPESKKSGAILSLLLGVSFVLEVALLGAVAFGAMWALPHVNPIVAILVTVVPLMIFWGLFMSPKASFRIASVMHAVLAHVLFIGGGLLLFLAGQPILAIAMGALTALSLGLTLVVGGQGVITEAVATRKAQAGGATGTGKGSGRRAAR